MYGTVARMRIKPGMEDRLLQLNQEMNAAGVPGLVAEYVYRMDGTPAEYCLAIVFESKEAYAANANAPEQHERYQQLRALMESDPEGIVKLSLRLDKDR
jgi:antibiotic biosynthesis monooxygenase (ABM) superfamily enzyme